MSCCRGWGFSKSIGSELSYKDRVEGAVHSRAPLFHYTKFPILLRPPSTFVGDCLNSWQITPNEFLFFSLAKSGSLPCQMFHFCCCGGKHEQAIGVCSRTILSFKNSIWTLIERLQSKQTNPVYSGSAPLPVGSWSSWWRWPRRRWSSWQLKRHSLFWQCFRFPFLPIFIVDWKPLPTMHIAYNNKKVWWTPARHLKSF